MENKTPYHAGARFSEPVEIRPLDIESCMPKKTRFLELGTQQQLSIILEISKEITLVKLTSDRFSAVMPDGYVFHADSSDEMLVFYPIKWYEAMKKLNRIDAFGKEIKEQINI